MPHMLESLITREDIANIAASEHLVLNDEIRISILETMRSVDVQACPGSGKTTLIAAKLILLAKKWPIQHQGICVLSHTNVAKNEITDRLKQSNTTEAQRLLSYPHFIGTIQEFVNRFLALPYLHSNGIIDITVDNDKYVKQARKLLNLNQFGWLLGTLNGLGDRDAQDSFLRGTFRYLSEEVEAININKVPGAWQQVNNRQRAERAIWQLKKYLDERGFFLFRDMYTHAKIASSLNEGLPKALRNRFPCIFIDEMQDTQKFQDELLCNIFPVDDSSLIVQRFGDPDQAIFHGIGSEEPNESFNGKSQDEMDFVIHKSHRFDGILADKIKSFSLNEISLETELSARTLSDRAKVHTTGGSFEHTIIVFNDDTRPDVINSFGRIVSHQFSDTYKKFQCFSAKVVGAVGKEIDPTQDQLRIGHYCPDYDKSKSKTNFEEVSLIEAVRYCRQSSSVDWAERYKLLINCILKLLRMAEKVDETGRHFSLSTLKDALSNRGNWIPLRKGVYWMLDDTNEINERLWTTIGKRLAKLLDLDNIPIEATEYLAFTEEFTRGGTIGENSQERASVVVLPDNRIKYSDGFEIELSTIHGVKGETHDATLIVETKNHTFDLETMLSYLIGELPSADHPNSRLPDKPNWRRVFKPNKLFMRQFYVAMSRPRHLLCLAIHSDRLSDTHKSLLLEKGWKIEILKSPVEDVK